MSDSFRAVWANYIVRPHTIVKNIRWRRRATISTQPHIFIIGAPRSGTTLVQSILNTHSKLCGFDYETAIFTKQNIFRPERYQRSHARNKIVELFKNSCDIVDFYDQFVSGVKASECTRVVEKTPQHINHLEFILKHFPNAQVVHVYRDGRDAYASAREHEGVIQGSSARYYARYWKKCIRSRMACGSHRNIYDLCYEKLVTQPRGEVAELMVWLGMKYEESQLDPSNYGRDKRAASKHFKRLSQPISPASIGKWGSVLSQSEIDEFNEIAGNELRSWGYLMDQTQESKVEQQIQSTR